MVKKDFIAFGKPKKPTNYLISCWLVPSEKQTGVLIWFKNHFNMVKKGFIAFGKPKKPRNYLISCWLVPSEKQIGVLIWSKLLTPNSKHCIISWKIGAQKRFNMV